MTKEFYQKLLDSLSDGVYFVDCSRRITYWSKAAERLSGYSGKEVLGKSCADNILRHVDANGTHLCADGCPLFATIADGKMRESDVFMHHKHGHRVLITVRSSPVRDDNGNIVGAVEVFSKHVKQADMLQEIENLRNEVLRDHLTGIGNRRYADITLCKCEETMRDHGVPFGVIFGDIDHFKKINDTWGHSVGDLVLKMIAQTISSSLRPLDAACRWGGEEFVVIAPNITAEALGILAKRLRMLVQNIWLDHDGNRISPTATFGGALSKKNESAASVVDRADRLVYEGKQAGRNCVLVEQC